MLSLSGLGEPRILLTTNVLNYLFFYFFFVLPMYIIHDYFAWIISFITIYICIFFCLYIVEFILIIQLLFVVPHVLSYYLKMFNFNGSFHSRCQAELHMGENVQTAASFVPVQAITSNILELLPPLPPAYNLRTHRLSRPRRQSVYRQTP